MRVGASSKAEVRIARDRIDGLVAALSGQGQMRPDQSVARALSVRLKAPNGGFTVESMSPETQWVETSSGLMQDDHAIWRWTVTPQRRGRGRLQLLVSARTIGHDGLAAESAPPDRVIEVRVAPNRMRRFGRLMAWIILLAAGVALGRYGDHLWGTVHLLIKKALAG
jgi:neural Wiskott-Aldrich syndrome protein